MRRKNLVLVAMLSGFTLLAQPVHTDKAESREEKLLREAGIGTDWDSILAFLRSPPPAAADAERLQRLVSQLGSENFQEREQAVKELVACGRAAVDPLKKALESRDAEVVSRAKACIQDIERRTSWQVYDVAARQLTQLRPAEAVSALLGALDHPDAMVRKAAYEMLCQAVVPKDLPDVLKAAKDQRPYVRAGAIGLSYKFKDQPKVFTPILLGALRDENALVRRKAAMFLRHFGSEEGVVLALIAALKDKDVTPTSEASVAQAAAGSLEMLGSRARPAIPALMELSKGGHESSRYCATIALGRLGANDRVIIPTIVPFFMQILGDRSQPIGNRAMAASALGLIGPDAKAAVPALREALKGDDAADPKLGYRTREAVLSALGRIGPEADAAVPDLTAILQDDKQSRLDRVGAAEALGAIGPAAKSAIPALTEALKDRDVVLKEVAARALEKVQLKPE